jgi:hypothetical protein
VPSADLVNARAAAERVVVRAWTVAMNAHDGLRAMANAQAAGAWDALLPEVKAETDRGLRTASRNLGLLMHHRPPTTAGHVVTISELDLAIAQDRAAQLARLVKKANDVTAADDRDGFIRWNSVGYITERILAILVLRYGPIRKDDATSVAMLRGLSAAYDGPRLQNVCTRAFL